MDEESAPPDDAMPQQPAEEPDRMAQPVDAEQPPRLPFPVVGVGASAGGLEAVGEFLDAMPADGGMAFVLVQHLPPDRESLMAEVLSRRTAMPVTQVEDGVPVEPDHVYVIRPGHILTIRDGRLHLGPPLGSPRAANRPIDDFFRSLAEEQRERAVCIVMSGMGSNGTAGAQAVKAVGGLCIAQDPESAQFPSMPHHLIDAGYADYILRPADLPEVLQAYARHPYASGGREADADATLRREGHHLREVLAILRTRTHQDFTGYKKPTLFRRVQRRMGLTRVADLAEYARLLRQSPTEVTALADDLLIHVTGFFRDPEAWEALRRLVIVPLVNAREAGGPIRAWVTACSSGEEAYTLAMLLTEESERVGKRLEIKVFATDLAQRALAHARAGIYPGGIESEIDPERLQRFFLKDDAVYQVRPALRDSVVFAPQNVLQDPPFSRLDIASCRNLLIYLEPAVQRRVLSLLHFGLREGGALLLGSSEMVAGAEGLFETLNKKARIFRRIGPTRHGSLEFPLPQPIGAGHAAREGTWSAVRRQEGPPPSVAELTRRVLLEAHTPPAVTVDRDGRIVYYHGETQPFLRQPSGEPTRELELLVREGVRGPMRVALHRAVVEGATATATDGWVEVEPGRLVQVAVTASPVVVPGNGDRAVPPDYLVVSFEDRGVFVPAGAEESGRGGEAGADELRRLRAELQGTIEELQTSNEELKASHEEVTSINEELQSANEELETSKEEMQSLNEELTTVNTQLRAKVEEHQASSSDLSSLLVSTDIAVLFLDMSFRIRRYTPAIRDLVDLIASDVGRPPAALARRFEDPHLDDDALAVLERLVPLEREVAVSGGRHFLRRVLPYRTTDNRIDGVVVTFVDISARKQAEEALRDREAWLRGQREALEAAMNGAALETALGVLVRTAIDGLGEGTRAAFYLANEEGTRLRHVVGMPADYTEAVDNFKIGSEPLACGLATHSGQPVLTRDVMQDAGWAPWRWLAERFDYRGCWSFPIHTAVGSFIGTLAIYSRQPREATPRDIELAWLLCHTASIIISREEESEARKRAEAALRTSEGRLRLSLLAARMGIWTLDLSTSTQTRDGNLNRLLGLEPADSTQPFAEFLEHIHPDDRDAVATAFAKSAEQGRPLNLEFRVLWPDGTVRWLRDQGDVFESAGETHMAGACVDVTERRQAEEALRESEEQFRRAIEDAPIPVILHAEDGEVLQISRTWTELTGYTLIDLPTIEAWLTRAYGPGANAVRAHMHELFRGDRRTLDVEFAIQTRGGPERHWSFSASAPGTLRDGRRFVVGMAIDITERKRAEDELRVGEEHLRLIVESATDYAIFTLGRDRVVTSWSPGAEVTFGFTEEEILGRPADIVFTPEDRAAGAPEAEAQTALREGRAADERWHLRKDGTRFFASGVLTPLGDGGSRGFVKVARDLTERKRIEDALREARDELERRVAERTAELARTNKALREAMAARTELLRRLVAAQEEERRRISRELHDGLGQELTALILGLKALERAVPEGSPDHARLADLHEVVGRMSREAHDLAVELRPTALDDIGLAAALAAYVARWAERTGLAAEFQPLGLDADRLPPEIETTIYRVVQEALNNVVKHSEARHVTVMVARQDGELTALIEDDGRGFDPERVGSGPGRRRLGLMGMRERVGLVGGTLLIESSEGEGTTVRARIPLGPPAGEVDHEA